VRRTRASSLTALMFLPYLVIAIAFLRKLFRIIFLRNEVTYPEGASVYSFLMALHTGRLYSPPYEFPFNVQLYGPVFYWTGSVLARIAHGDPLTTTILCRSITFGAYLGCAVCAGLICWKLEKRVLWAWIAVVLGLACAWAVPWAASARPDVLAVFFILLALLIYLGAEGRIWLVFVAAAVASLSWLTKQTTALVLFALALDCLIGRRWKELGALVAGSVPIPAFILAALSLRREPFLANYWASRNAVISWYGPVKGAIFGLRANSVALVPICVALLGVVLIWRRRDYRSILLAVIFGSVSNLAAMANVGASTNYLILPWMLTLLMIPAGLSRIEQWTMRRTWIPVAILIASTVLLAHQKFLLAQTLPSDLDASRVSSLTMLSDQSYLELLSREPQLLDPYVYGNFSLRKVWDDAPILQRIDGEHYDLILMSMDPRFGSWAWGADMRAEMEGHYRVLCEADNRIAMVPQHRVDSVQAEDLTRIFKEPCNASANMPQYLGRG